ncbi:hypothetical protein TYRP_017977 [Tyrophagus putrescentiae]|nr:hypothetical protein TYRP_017977 [Tyrophagus putrescentiae]
MCASSPIGVLPAFSAGSTLQHRKEKLPIAEDCGYTVLPGKQSSSGICNGSSIPPTTSISNKKNNNGGRR